MRVLVTGGTGVIGKPVMDRLLERGHEVRLLSRHADRDAANWPGGVEAFPASIGDEESLRGAAEGCDAVLHIAGIISESPPEITFERVNVQGTRALLAEAQHHGVRRFIFVSSLGAERGSSDYHRSKAAAEESVREFPGSWLILRPGNVYGPGDYVISLLLKMVRTLPAVPLIGNGGQPFQPIWAEDLGRALARAVEQEDLSRVTLELAGDEVVTPRELLDRLEELTGKHPSRVPVPEWVARTGAELAETFGIDLPVKSDQLVMLAETNVIQPGHANALREVFGIEPTPLGQGLRQLADTLPEQLPGEGIGPLRRHRFWADIQGSRLSAAQLFERICTDFPSLPDKHLMRVGVEPASSRSLVEGATLTLSIPLRGNIQVRVEEVLSQQATAATLEGHPLSGLVRFLVEEHGDLLRFEVRTFTRASTLVDMVAMSTVGEPLKAAAWRAVVEEVVRRSGGEAVDGVQMENEIMDEETAADVERWAEDLVRRRERCRARESREQTDSPSSS